MSIDPDRARVTLESLPDSLRSQIVGLGNGADQFALAALEIFQSLQEGTLTSDILELYARFVPCVLDALSAHQHGVSVLLRSETEKSERPYATR